MTTDTLEKAFHKETRSISLTNVRSSVLRYMCLKLHKKHCVRMMKHSKKKINLSSSHRLMKKDHPKTKITDDIN